MSGSILPDLRALRPILDMYMSAPVALLGCHSVGLSRPACELDVLVVTPDSRPTTTALLGRVPVDLYFVNEKEALKPANPEYSVALAFARPVRDSSLLLSTSSAANSAVLSESAKKSSRARLASSLKALGRAEDALSRGSQREADFWAQAASYDFAFAWVYSSESLPCPSHLLQQLRGLSKGASKGFEAFSAGAGLERGTRRSCAQRVEGVGVIHDLIRRRREPGPADQSSWSAARTSLVKDKADALTLGAEVAEAYSYLGIESIRALAGLARRNPKGPIGDPGQQRVAGLFTGEKKLLGEALLGELGFGRQRRALEGAVRGLKDQVPRIARRL